MNDEVKERFKSTFEAIRESFKWPLNRCLVEVRWLLTEATFLTAGVEISVQPPGKKNPVA